LGRKVHTIEGNGINLGTIPGGGEGGGGGGGVDVVMIDEDEDDEVVEGGGGAGGGGGGGGIAGAEDVVVIDLSNLPEDDDDDREHGRFVTHNGFRIEDILWEEWLDITRWPAKKFGPAYHLSCVEGKAGRPAGML
jgi:hypothetical protein